VPVRDGRREILSISNPPDFAVRVTALVMQIFVRPYSQRVPQLCIWVNGGDVSRERSLHERLVEQFR